MDSRGRNAPPVEGGEFLLQLLRRPSSSSNPPQAYPNDAWGPSASNFTHPRASFSGYDFSYHRPSYNYFQRQSPNFQPSYQFPTSYTSSRGNFPSDGGELRRGFNGENPVSDVGRDPKNLIFGSVNVKQGLGTDRRGNGSVNERDIIDGFENKRVDHSSNRRNEANYGNYRAVSGKTDVEDSEVALNDDIDDLEEHLVGSLGLDDEPCEKSETKKFQRDQDHRSDMRRKGIMGQRTRNLKSQSLCRSSIRRLDGPFLAVLESLIPIEEEKIKQRQLLTLLAKLVAKEWPGAQLYLYGSCANSFDLSKSDIDVCLAMELGDIGKCDVLLRLADILQSENLQNVQALTRARVPIVKLMHPVTGISCDICINNMLAVVNTKLLRDYAQIDPRLRQLAYIVKHWAKSRGVNATYQGTLSSYAYVLMCIHFLQQRRPAILPCLQGMEVTYCVTVDNVECSFYDEVEKVRNYGARNGESIAELVWAFFHYWAYCHDYATDVISIRTGTTLSKRDKKWTRRADNERHLICIEDPFDLSHDLGRVVDKYSVRVLREEFVRAAKIMEHVPNPCAKLFEPYAPY